MRDLLSPRNRPNLVYRPDIRTQPAVHAQHLAVNERSQREVVKHLAAGLPDGRVAVFLLALVVETVHLEEGERASSRSV